MQRQERGRKEPSEFNVIVKCKDLIKHTFTITNSTERFPKKYRFTLVNRIQDKAVDIYECALEANELNLLDAQEFKERQRLQAKAMTYCKELLFFIELSHEQGFISTNSCEYWSKLALDVKYMLAAPNSSNAQNVRNVNSDGTLNNNNAYNGNRGVRPLRWKMRSSRRKPKAEYHHQRKVYPAAAIHSGGKYRIADARAFRAAEGKGYKQRGYFL